MEQKLTELWLSEDRITERAETRAMKYWKYDCLDKDINLIASSLY